MKFFFDDEVSRCLEVNSEYKRIFVGPFLLCEIKGVCAFKPDEIARIQSVERRGCKSSLTIEVKVKDAVHCTAVKFFFDDEISRCLEMQGEEVPGQMK